MIFALLSTFIASFSDVFWKKSLSYNIWTRAHDLASFPIGLLICIYFITTSFSLSQVTIISILLVCIVAVMDLLRQPIMQQVYKEEKISVIIPYLNLSRIFIIVASFFIFQDVSNITFFIILVTIWVIIIWSIDFKTFRMPRNFLKLVCVELLRVWSALLWGWIVVQYWEITFFTLSVIVWTLILSFLVVSTEQYQDLLSAPQKFWFHRQLAALGWISWFLSLVVISELWLSVWILLWFIWIWATLLFSYIFLWDTPSKKSILLTLVVSLLIWIWYYFK